MLLASLLGMMQFTDSAVPTGAFSHSLGFETYLSREEITGEEDFSAWLHMFVREQLCYTDAVAIRLLYRCKSTEEILELADVLNASTLPRQIREASATMGRRLLHLAQSNLESPTLHEVSQRVESGSTDCHPAIVWAMIAKELGLAQEQAVASHLYATVISLTQNAVRAIPLGQNTGQRIISSAQPWVLDATQVSSHLGYEDLGAIAPGLEIAQMHHERQNARMFMS